MTYGDGQPTGKRPTRAAFWGLSTAEKFDYDSASIALIPAAGSCRNGQRKIEEGDSREG